MGSVYVAAADYLAALGFEVSHAVKKAVVEPELELYIVVASSAIWEVDVEQYDSGSILE